MSAVVQQVEPAVATPPRKHRLSHSRMRSFRKCARLEHYQYERGIRPIVDAKPLAFGSLWHGGQDAWWGAVRDGKPEEALARGLAAIGAWSRSGVDQWDKIAAEELLRGYDKRWGGEPLAVVGIEDRFAIPLLNPRTFQASRTWELVGAIDKRVETPAGRRLAVEHKTATGDIGPGTQYWAKLSMDHQVSIYWLALEALGWPADGCLYDVVRKPGQESLKATPIEKRKYTKEGKLYANQREHDETPEEYRTRVREAIEEDPGRYFQRQEIPRIESQLRDFLFDAWATARQIHQTHKDGFAPRNPEACFAYGECPFATCCSVGADPADRPTEFSIRKPTAPAIPATAN